MGSQRTPKGNAMRVAVIGAGSVGRSIARELIHHGHQVLIIDRERDPERPARVPEAEWIIGDACEISTLNGAQLQGYDHVVCATGDDKVNLVVSLLAKTEFAVPRTVARVNNPRNEWLFTDAWGVDVAVSTPRLMTALVEEAVEVGDLVRLFEFDKGAVRMVAFTLSQQDTHLGSPLRELPLPQDVSIISLLRDGRPLAPTPDEVMEAGDELLFLCAADSEMALAEVMDAEVTDAEVTGAVIGTTDTGDTRETRDISIGN